MGCGTYRRGMDVTWRALSGPDIPAWCGLVAAVQLADRTGEGWDEGDLAEELHGVGVDPLRDTLVAELPGGELVAYGMVTGPAAPGRDFYRVFAWGGVHPDHRGRGLGRSLMAWQRERGTEMHRERYPGMPGMFMANCLDSAAQIPLYRRVGMAPVRWSNEMVRDLTDPPPSTVGDGLTLVGFAPDLDDTLHAAHNEAFAHHWASVPLTEEEWRTQRTGSKAFRPDLTFMVLDADRQVAAYAIGYFWEADAAASGVRTAYAGQIGTRPAFRRQGLATAVIEAFLRAAAAGPYDRAMLDVDTGNATGALGLYERVGFTLVKQWITYAADLLPVT